MGNLKMEFFEEYKRLDNLCDGMYAAKAGITQYIDDMKEKLSNDYCHVPYL